MAHQRGHGFVATPLDAVAAQRMHRLRGESQMRAHRYAARDEELDRGRKPRPAFDLDHLSAGLHQAHGIVERRLWRALVTAKRHVSQQPRALRAACDCADVVLDVFDRYRQRR